MSDHVDQASPRTPKHGFRRKLMIGAALAGVASAAGLAFGEWLASGNGEGYAKSGVAQALTTEFVTASDSLYPGGTGDLVLRIHNPNPFPVTVASVTPNGPVTSSDEACEDAGHGVTFTGVSGLSLVVGSQTSATFTLTGALAMATTSANECQGVDFTVPVSLNGGAGGQLQTWYADADLDGFGDPNNTTQAGEPPSGFVGDATDCDDAHSTVNPGAAEVADQLDNDCDGVVDEDLPLLTWYPDTDGDGYGDSLGSFQFVTPPQGWIGVGGDCDDINDTVYPGATEIPDNLDNDCDDVIDDGAPATWYADFDHDNFGDPNNFVVSEGMPPSYVPAGDDCDDTNSFINPAATDVAGNGIDDDCDGAIDEGA